MVKRRKSQVSEKDSESMSPDSSDSEAQPKKLLKRNSLQAKLSLTPDKYLRFKNRPSTGIKKPKFKSTPYGNSSLRNGASTSASAIKLASTSTQGSFIRNTPAHYDSFTSFMHSNSLLSDDDDDDSGTFPTVSQLAQKSPVVSTPAPKKEPEVPEKNIVYLVPKNRLQKLADECVAPAHDQIVSIPVPVKNQEIVILQHECCLTLHGYLKVTILAGSASILGYNIKEGKSVHVFSTPRAGKKQIETRSSVHKISSDDLAKKLSEIKEIDCGITIGKYMEHIGPNSVVVLLERCLLPPQLQFLELYLPHAVEMDFPSFCSYYKSMCSTEIDVIKVSSDAETTADQLRTLLDLKDSDPKSPSVRVLMHGPKGSGKSTLLRYLLHTVLNDNYSDVYYLDTDPGQTEFSPPGCVSLTKVTKPLLEPPYCHNIDPEEMIFTGATTPAVSPSMFLQSVKQLIASFEKNHKDAVLFVNTMGWIDGVGDICFQHIQALVKPTLLVDLVSPKECRAINIQPGDDDSVVVQVPIKGYTPRLNAYSPKDKRNFHVLTYLGKCQKSYMPPTYMNSIRPVCISWDDIAIYIGKKVPVSKLIRAIQCCVVALCHVENVVEHVKVESGTKDLKAYPKTLSEEPLNRCIGFGFVRAIDEKNHLLYIVTPLSLDQLSEVNAIMKGEIVIPDEVILKQPIEEQELPYTNESSIAPATIQRSVKKRQFIPQTLRNL